jgi:hypothetical protein
MGVGVQVPLRAPKNQPSVEETRATPKLCSLNGCGGSSLLRAPKVQPSAEETHATTMPCSLDGWADSGIKCNISKGRTCGTWHMVFLSLSERVLSRRSWRGFGDRTGQPPSKVRAHPGKEHGWGETREWTVEAAQDGLITLITLITPRPGRRRGHLLRLLRYYAQRPRATMMHFSLRHLARLSAELCPLKASCAALK